MKGHTGYYACTKCETKGNYIHRRVVYPEINAVLRADMGFRNRIQQQFHKNSQTIELEKVNIGCVSQFPVDYMHCVLLGVMRQVLRYWISTKKNNFPCHHYKL